MLKNQISNKIDRGPRGPIFGVSMRPRISHVEIYVSQYKESILFYDKVLKPMGFERVNCCKTFTAYSDGFGKIIICPVEEKYKDIPYHRKGIGLNHLAIYADSKEEVDIFHEEIY